MKMVVRRSIAIAAGFVLAALGSSAEGAASTKFGAWSLGSVQFGDPLDAASSVGGRAAVGRAPGPAVRRTLQHGDAAGAGDPGRDRGILRDDD